MRQDRPTLQPFERWLIVILAVVFVIALALAITDHDKKHETKQSKRQSPTVTTMTAPQSQQSFGLLLHGSLVIECGPPVQQVVVQTGDTLSGLLQRYNVVLNPSSDRPAWVSQADAVTIVAGANHLRLVSRKTNNW